MQLVRLDQVEVVEVWKTRIIATNASGGVVDTRLVDDAGIEAAHDELHELDGVRMVETAGRFLYRRDVVEIES